MINRTLVIFDISKAVDPAGVAALALTFYESEFLKNNNEYYQEQKGRGTFGAPSFEYGSNNLSRWDLQGRANFSQELWRFIESAIDEAIARHTEADIDDLKIVSQLCISGEALSIDNQDIPFQNYAGVIGKIKEAGLWSEEVQNFECGIKSDSGNNVIAINEYFPRSH